MQKAINYFFLPLFITILACAVLIKVGTNEAKTKSTNYMLKAYKNTVALYDNDSIVEIYDDIVLNSLPKTDIYNFSKGIQFESRENAELYLEDFDSWKLLLATLDTKMYNYF